MSVVWGGGHRVSASAADSLLTGVFQLDVGDVKMHVHSFPERSFMIC